MVWKIILFLVYFNVTVKAGQCSGKSAQLVPVEENNLIRNRLEIPRNFENPQSSSSCESQQSSSSSDSQQSLSSNECRQEHLEKLYNVKILTLLNAMPTLTETDVTFDEDDIQLLTVECYPDVNCLNKKKGSVKKYRQKIQAIQCIHGLFVLKVLDELEYIRSITRLFNIHFLEPFLEDTVSKHRVYLTKMLSLLNLAKIAAYPWQIEMFTFVEGLVDSDAEFEIYKVHFINNNQRMRGDTLAVIDKCIEHEYLTDKGNTSQKLSTILYPITGLVDGVYSQMELMYKNADLDAFRSLQDYTVSNLMFVHLYRQHDFVFEWLENGLELDTSSIKSKFQRYAETYPLLQVIHKWELDPIKYNKYNALISKCIHLRLVYAVWVHLYLYQNLQSRPTDEKSRLYQIWNTLVYFLSRNLRLFGFNENIYWSAIYFMRIELKNISDEELNTREKFTRSYFCQAANDLGLGSLFVINRQLSKTDYSENHDIAYNYIVENFINLDSFENHITRTFYPVDGSFLRIIVSAKKNVTFFKHLTI